MGKTKIKVTGVNQVVRNAEKVSDKLKGIVIDRIIQAGLTIETTTKNTVPVDTGRLKTSYHTEYQFDGKRNFGAYSYTDNKGKSFNGSFSQKPKEDELLVGSNVEYAARIERNGLQLESAKDREVARLNLDLKEIVRRL